MKEGNTGFGVGLQDILILPQLAGDDVRIGTQMLDPGSFQQLGLPPPIFQKSEQVGQQHVTGTGHAAHVAGVSSLGPCRKQDPATQVGIREESLFYVLKS